MIRRYLTFEIQATTIFRVSTYTSKMLKSLCLCLTSSLLMYGCALKLFVYVKLLLLNELIANSCDARQNFKMKYL